MSLAARWLTAVLAASVCLLAAGVPAAPAQEAGAQDAEAQDAGAQDAGAQDAGAQDAGAQDAGGDVFDTSTFDQAVQEGTEQNQEAKPEARFGGSLLYDTSATTTAAFGGYAASGTFSGKAFVKVSVPGSASAYAAYNFSKNLYQGAAGTVPGASLGPSGPVLSQAAGDLYGASYALAEIYLAVDVARAVFFRIGNQLVAWGPSLIWTPVDFVNLQRVNPLSPLDLRVGKPGIKATIPLGISNVFLFADLSQTVTPTGSGGALVVNDPVRSTTLAVRWDLTVLGYELALAGLAGFDVQSRAGFDFSGRLLGFDVYGETAAAVPTGSSAFSWSASVGLQRTLGELGYWSTAAELYFNGSGTSDISAYPGLAASGTLNPLYVGQWYAYASIARAHLFVDGLSAALAGFADFSDGSFLAHISTTIDVPMVPPFTLSVSWAGGGEGKAFTYFTGNNALTAELQMTLAF